MTETLEQIALRIAEEYDPEEKYLPYRNDVVEFAKRLVEALGAQEPVGYIYSEFSTQQKFGAIRAKGMINGDALYAAPKPGEVK